jgi:hypothetical protein
MFKDRLDDVGVMVDTELIRDDQEQCVSLCDGFVFREVARRECPARRHSCGQKIVRVLSPRKAIASPSSPCRGSRREWHRK